LGNVSDIGYPFESGPVALKKQVAGPVACFRHAIRKKPLAASGKE